MITEDCQRWRGGRASYRPAGEVIDPRRYDVPGNGESWFVARAFDELRRLGFAGVLSFSDPVERRAVSGELVKPGHRGVIYQALGGVYTGRATPRSLWIMPDGTVFSDRALSKLRAGERGRRYAAAQLVAAGAVPLEPGEDAGAWARRELRRIGRRQRHHDNHRYLFPLSRACRRALPAHLERRGLAPQAYPRVA